MSCDGTVDVLLQALFEGVAIIAAVLSAPRSSKSWRALALILTRFSLFPINIRSASFVRGNTSAWPATPANSTAECVYGRGVRCSMAESPRYAKPLAEEGIVMMGSGDREWPREAKTG